MIVRAAVPYNIDWQPLWIWIVGAVSLVGAAIRDLSSPARLQERFGTKRVAARATLEAEQIIPILADLVDTVSGSVGRAVDYESRDAFLAEVNAALNDQGYREKLRDLTTLQADHLDLDRFQTAAARWAVREALAIAPVVLGGFLVALSFADPRFHGAVMEPLGFGLLFVGSIAALLARILYATNEKRLAELIRRYE